MSLSAVSSALCFALTPFNIAFWGALVPDTRALLETVAIDWARMLVLVVCVLLVPVLLGAAVVARAPQVAARLRRPIRRGSIAVFSVFVLAALFANGQLFLEWIGNIAGLVALHNGAALLLGYAAATAMHCATPERRAISIEVGIQNTALGLTLIFTLFDGLGGAALITAWWGVWHLLSGAALGAFWSRGPMVAATIRTG